MTIEILDRAAVDLIDGFHFYEAQQPGLGDYFLNSLYSDIESLQLFAGIHRKAYKKYHRLLSKRFPYAVFYTVSKKTVFVHAVVDCRRDPDWIGRRL
jgi:plasmid stabilization system protein ParE